MTERNDRAGSPRQRRAAYVVIADIVGYSKAEQATQAQWVRTFFEVLRQALEATGSSDHNVFPTGDGAILALYGRPPTTEVEAPIALNLARDLLRLNADNPFQLRV